MIIVLLIHILIIVLERFLYLRDFTASETKEETQQDHDQFSLLNLKQPDKSNSNKNEQNKDPLNPFPQEDAPLLNLKDLNPLANPPEEDKEPENIVLSFKDDYFPKRNIGILLKYILQIILLVLVNYIIFWYFPNSGNKKLNGEYICRDTAKQCNEATSNIWIAIFYFLFCIYFSLSALQVKYGWPEIRNIKTLRKKNSLVNSILVRLYLSVPFMLELQMFMDWAFTKTSLDIFQWLKFDDIYANLYLSRYSYSTYKSKGLGTAMGTLYKILFSSIGIIAIIFLMIGPMIIFSNLNPIAQENKITGASIVFGIYAISDHNYYALFSTSHVASLTDITPEKFASESLGLIDEIKGADIADIQVVTIQPYSDTVWIPTEKVKNRVLGLLDSHTNNSNAIQFYMNYEFSRTYHPEYAKSKDPVFHDVSNITSSSLSQSIRNCTGTPYKAIVPTFYKKILRLPSQANPTIIGSNDEKVIALNITLFLNCTDSNAIKTYSCELSLGSEKAIEFIIWSEKVTTSLLGYSAITLYLSVVIVVGNLIKGASRNGALSIIINDLPETGELLNLCEGVLIYRLEKNLKM